MKLDISQVCEEWRGKGFSCAAWNDPAGQEWVDFVHTTDELVMLLEGQIEISFQGEIYQPDIGQEIFIPAGASHTVRNTGTGPNRWLYGYRGE